MAIQLRDLEKNYGRPSNDSKLSSQDNIRQEKHQMIDIYNKFMMNYTYKKENLLFKVLFDKRYRPEIFEEINGRANYKQPKENQKKDIRKEIFNIEKNMEQVSTRD